ncbi:methyltransferase [Pectobacterium actinidiae]|uniref:methyltransferase n=1 Tax=Pectobacterium actinidiae TaxID=1507808 RepID=UPI00382B8BDE
MFARMFQRHKPQPRPLFAPGTLKLSEKVHWLAMRGLIDPLAYAHRHVRGDWGDIDQATRQANSVALDQDSAMVSRYPITPSLELIVTTNEERTITVLQLPEERDLL